MNLDQVANFVRSRVTESITQAQTTIPVQSVESFPDPSDTGAGGSYKCVLFDGEYPTATDDPNREIVTVTGVDATADELTVKRGEEDTTASAHPNTSRIYNAYTAAFRDDVQAALNDKPDYADLYSGTAKYFVSPKDGDDTNAGDSWRTALASISEAFDRIRADRSDLTRREQPDPVTVQVDAGEMTIDNPLVMPEKTSVMGNDLRTTQLFPENPKLDLFHMDSLCHLWGLRFYDHQYPSFTTSFPRVVAEPVMSGGEVTDINLLYSPEGYLQGPNSATPSVVIDPPRNGTQAQADVTINNGKVTDITVTDTGSGYDTKPNISVPAPETKQPFVIGSPYVLNCSTITGPFTTSGTEIPPTVSYPYNIDNPVLFNAATGETETYDPVDPEGAGGGMLVDGRLCFGKNQMTETDADSNIPSSPLNSFVAAQYTQVNQGGPGHLVINSGFAQFVSMFTTFCSYGFKTKTGGLALCSNSVSDLGIEGLVAEGKSLNTYNTGTVTQDESSSVAKIEVQSGGSGFTNPTLTIDPPTNGGTQATAEATVSEGEITGVVITEQGDGYESTPDVTVTGNGGGAVLSVEMNKVGTITVNNLNTFEQADGSIVTKRPQANSVLQIGDKERTIRSYENLENANNEFTISFTPGLFSVDSGVTAEMYELSNINSGGHVFEYPGSGVTYNALPEYGGIPDLDQMIKEFGSGKVYHTSSDNYGNFYVGDQFAVNQQTGEVTLNADKFNLSGLNSVGPFSVNGVTYGVQLREVSNRTDLRAGSELPEQAVPTINAIRDFFLTDNRTIPNGGLQDQALVKSSDQDRDTEWDTVARPADIEAHRANEVHDTDQPPQTHGDPDHEYDVLVDGSPIDDTDTIEFVTDGS